MAPYPSRARPGRRRNALRRFRSTARLKLIIVDEEHETTYKQEETPRYHARDTAIVRAQRLGATVVLGSATPSMESFRNAERKKFEYVHLTARVEDRPLPDVEIVNMREEYAAEGKAGDLLATSSAGDRRTARTPRADDGPAEPSGIRGVPALPALWVHLPVHVLQRFDDVSPVHRPAALSLLRAGATSRRRSVPNARANTSITSGKAPNASSPIFGNCLRMRVSDASIATR